MTALPDYARLEAPARYFDGVSARPREVWVSFGNRSLVIVGEDGIAIAHWALDGLSARSDRGDQVLQVAPDAASDERLAISDATMIAALRRVCPRLYRRPADRRGIGKAAFWGVAAVAAVLVIVFVILPRLAGQLAYAIPPESEQKLGDQVVGQIQTVLGVNGPDPGFCTGPEGLEALAAMEARLDAGAGLPYELRIAVMDHGMVNAFAVPGGRIVLFRGLIEAAASPEEVAGVLAHEIGHVVHRDPTVAVLRSAGTAGILGMLVGDVFGAAIVVAATETVMNASYAQEAERRADRTGLEILARAELPSRPFAGFFRRMAERYGDDLGILGYVASHPALGERAERAEAADTVGEARFVPVLDDTEWVALRQICRETAEDPPAR